MLVHTACLSLAPHAFSPTRTAGIVAFTLELTTPACPVKEMFQRQSTQVVKVSWEPG